MFDDQLRPIKKLLLAPVVPRLSFVSPLTLTILALAAGLGSGVAASQAFWWLALALFIVNRTLDGLDGEVARHRGSSSDLGGYADIVADVIVYSAIPLGAAAGSEIDHIWVVTAFLLASFYINTITWSYLAAIIEKTRIDKTSGTSTVMPRGLVEGGETVLFFLGMLALPQLLDWTMGVMAVTTLAGALLRFSRAQLQLLASDQK